MTQLPALIDRAAPRQAEPDSSPIVRLQKLILAEAAEIGASDIHIEPHRVSTRVRCRVDGVLRQTAEIPRWMHDNLVVRIKVLAHLDVAERRVPQDGHIDAESTGSDDVRVSTVPTRWGEKLVLRLLKRARYALSLRQLGFPQTFEDKLQNWIRRSQGILFVVGPTGSGKTTTLYGLINELREEPLNVVTIEDPIEYEVEGITQIQINEKSGLTFARVLRAILRQDPDVILVGEIRDAETAKTAVHAAMTGHLVLSTLHATDSVSALFRLAELGIEHSVAANVVLGVVAQRLVRLNCTACAEPDHPRPSYLDCLEIPLSEAGRVRRSPGCEACGFTGTKGRAGMFELLEIGGKLRDLCAQGNESRLRRAVLEAGMINLRQQAATLALAGAISVDEAYRFGYFGDAT
jgi:type II secretory ATPase GspE/PulE/Tfp pilus assembly ATPase PilB-like protein